MVAKILTVHCKPLRPHNKSQSLVGLGSVNFLWEARQEQKMLNIYTVGRNDGTDLSRF